MRRSLSAPFGERTRTGRGDERLVSRGLVVESGPQHRARQALRAAEQLSRAVVDGLEEGVVVTNEQLRAVSWNASALAILGLDAAALSIARAPFLPAGFVDENRGTAVTDADNPARTALRARVPATATLRTGDRWITLRARPIEIGTNELTGVVCTFADVTAAYAGERRLREERDRAQRYLEVASTLVVVLDHRGRVELINAQGCALLGFAEEELIGKDWFSTAVPPADRLDSRRAFLRLVSGVEAPADSLETCVVTRSGEARTIAWRNAILAGDDGAIVSVVRSGEDVTERRRAEAQVAYLAYHDPLTALPNRAQLEHQLQRDLARARRSGHTVALIYFDLDNFKLVNDSLGHAAGDAVLRDTALRVSELTRAGDMLARQGGDEFLLLLNSDGAGSGARAAAIAAGERIADALERPFVISGAEFHVGASIGVALFPEHGRDPETLLKRADSAMYQAKAAGGGTVAVYRDEGDDSHRRLSMTSRLRRALGNGELRLYYQPIHDVARGTIVGVEALVRWQDPDHGLIGPGGFIPVAEETGLIDQVGDWVMEELCVQATRWAALGHRPQLCFNLSPRQLRQAGLVRSIVDRIEEHGLNPGQFCAELTETLVLSDARRHRSLLDELNQAGLTVAIDDFGAGHSSLARLRDLPVQALKVDRSFLRRVPEDPGSSAIVAAILDLGEALGMTAVVEGVEHRAQLEFLRMRGCPRAQGYLLGRPVPPTDLRLVGAAVR
jgi:diguanylate cyclase (GGDEF)-like protein/PAS domain S-box-containing protein